MVTLHWTESKKQRQHRKSVHWKSKWTGKSLQLGQAALEHLAEFCRSRGVALLVSRNLFFAALHPARDVGVRAEDVVHALLIIRREINVHKTGWGNGASPNRYTSMVEALDMRQISASVNWSPAAYLVFSRKRFRNSVALLNSPCAFSSNLVAPPNMIGYCVSPSNNKTTTDPQFPETILFHLW